MASVTLELNADAETVAQPVLWRLGKLFHVATHVRRALVSEDSGHVTLDVEGAAGEIERARGYLGALGILKGGGQAREGGAAGQRPEDDIEQPNTIYVRLSPVTPDQARFPYLYRVGRDFDVVVNLARAGFDDDEDGGFMEVSLSGPLAACQRAIAYLHTTGIHVNPRQRSVTDYGNL